MPELPEVETVVRELRQHGLTGGRIRSVELRCPSIFGNDPQAVIGALEGHCVTSIGRRAKYIVLDLDQGARVLIHLRMTGKLYLPGDGTPPGRHDHVVITLEGGRRLFYNDTRKFGRFVLCTEQLDPLAVLGPEPLEKTFTAACLAERLAGCKRRIKPALLDQRVVAGLGNIYVDEALWCAGLHPERRADSLKPAEIAALHSGIRRVLAAGVRNHGTTLGSGQGNFYSVARRRGRNSDQLNVFRRDGLPCPRCGAIIARAIVAQRGTHFCPACQPL